MIDLLVNINEAAKRFVLGLQDLTMITLRVIWRLFTPPWYFRETLEQMHFVGIGSLGSTGVLVAVERAAAEGEDAERSVFARVPSSPRGADSSRSDPRPDPGSARNGDALAVDSRAELRASAWSSRGRPDSL